MEAYQRELESRRRAVSKPPGDQGTGELDWYGEADGGAERKAEREVDGEADGEADGGAGCEAEHEVDGEAVGGVERKANGGAEGRMPPVTECASVCSPSKRARGGLRLPRQDLSSPLAYPTIACGNASPHVPPVPLSASPPSAGQVDSMLVSPIASRMSSTFASLVRSPLFDVPDINTPSPPKSSTQPEDASGSAPAATPPKESPSDAQVVKRKLPQRAIGAQRSSLSNARILKRKLLRRYIGANRSSPSGASLPSSLTEEDVVSCSAEDVTEHVTAPAREVQVRALAVAGVVQGGEDDEVALLMQLGFIHDQGGRRPASEIFDLSLFVRHLYLNLQYSTHGHVPPPSLSL